MARNTSSKTAITGSKTGTRQSKATASLAVAQQGIKTSNDFAGLMGSLMGDLIAGKVTPEVGNAVCKAGSNLLKVVEMQHRYGKRSSADGPNGVLRLIA
jgi:hypothetical protein